MHHQSRKATAASFIGSVGAGSGEPVDPDAGLPPRSDRTEVTDGARWKVLAAIAAGGALGASARYGVSLSWPIRSASFPWATFAVNVIGCGLIGVLMVVVGEVRSVHPLVRPFLATGVLGGFTTFSAYALEIAELLSRGKARTAMAYAVGSLVTALGAVQLAAVATRVVVGRRGGGAR